MDTLHHIFRQLKPSTLPGDGLKGRILAAIALELERRLKRERSAAYAGMVLSAAVALAAGFGYGTDLVRSDFWSIVSLIFSDAAAMAGYWDSFLYSLLETFPAAAFAAFILPIFVFLVSLGMYSRFRHDADQHRFVSHAL